MMDLSINWYVGVGAIVTELALITVLLARHWFLMRKNERAIQKFEREIAEIEKWIEHCRRT